MRASQKISLLQDSIFGVISALAKKHQAINLGQGFPDFDGPAWIKELVSESILKSTNQYAPFAGVLSLREAIAQTQKHFYNLSYDPESEITITSGATEAIFISLLSHLDPGDEVIVFEPFYDSYLASTLLAGAKPVPVTLHAPDFSFDPDELKKAISPKTKMVLFNNPHNPSGKIFSPQEVEALAQVAREHDLLVLSDEVYEFLCFDQIQHRPLALLPGMKERTLTISSAGKIFGYTGWKIGWLSAPEKFTEALRKVHQYNVFSVITPVQEALAEAFSLPRFLDYTKDYQRVYQEKRDSLSSLFSHLKNFRNPQGTYFMMIPLQEITSQKAYEFSFQCIQKYGLAMIPPESFYMKSREGENYLRLCFAKKAEVLEKARLALTRILESGG